MKIASGTRDVDVEHLVGDVENHKLREEYRACQYFLVDSQPERATQSIQLGSGNSQRNNRERETGSFFQQFELCSKVNLALVSF